MNTTHLETNEPISDSQSDDTAFWKSRRFQRGVTLIWTGLVVFFIVQALATNWQELSTIEWQVDVGLLALAMVSAMLRRLIGGIRWSMTVALVNREAIFTNLSTNLRVYFFSNMATYIPGSYWFIPSRIYMNAREGLSALRTTFSIILEQIVLLLAGIMVATLYLPIALNALSLPTNFPLILLGILVIGFFLIHPRVLSAFVNGLMRLRKQETLDIEVSYLMMVGLLVVSIAVWLVGGASLYYLIRAVYSGINTDILTVSSIFAIAWLVGFFVPLAPAGFGVREGVMFTLFSTMGIPPGMATVISLLSRLLIVSEDVGWFILVTIYARRAND